MKTEEPWNTIDPICGEYVDIQIIYAIFREKMAVMMMACNLLLGIRGKSPWKLVICP
jgi:hypothetical protein